MRWKKSSSFSMQREPRASTKVCEFSFLESSDNLYDNNRKPFGKLTTTDLWIKSIILFYFLTNIRLIKKMRWFALRENLAEFVDGCKSGVAKQLVFIASNFVAFWYFGHSVARIVLRMWCWHRSREADLAIFSFLTNVFAVVGPRRPLNADLDEGSWKSRHLKCITIKYLNYQQCHLNFHPKHGMPSVVCPEAHAHHIAFLVKFIISIFSASANSCC